MQKIIGLLFILSAYGFGAIGSLTIPHDIDSAAIPKVIYIDQNNDSIVNKVNEIKDTVNAYLPGGGVYTGTALTSTGNLRFTVDSDNNGTGNCVVVTHNTATDTIAKFCDDLGAKLFGALTGTSGTFSGTLGVTGLQSNAEALAFTGNGTVLAGRIGRTAAGGLVLWGVAGSSYDLSIRNAAGDNLIQNPTGGSVTEFPRAGGVSITGPLGLAGVLTATATGGGSSAGITSSATTPSFALRETDAAANNGWWDIGASAEQLRFRAVDDANSAAGSYMTVDRTGTTIDAVTFPSPVTHSSAFTQTGAATFATNITQSAGVGSYSVDDNTTTAWEVKQGSNGYLKVTTTNSSENVSIGNVTTNPSYSFLGAGDVTMDSLISRKLYHDTNFTVTLRGCASDPTGTAYAVRVGKQVTLAIPYLTCTSDSAGAAITGLPAEFQSARSQGFAVNFVENSTNTLNTTAGLVVTGAAVRFSIGGLYTGPFTASGTRTLYGTHGSGGFTTITYILQ